MYYLKKTFEFSAAHHLNLSYASGCTNLHGHNWMVTVYLRSKTIDENGMVEDFKHIKEKVQGRFDHALLNDILPQPTAENIAKFIHDDLAPLCYRVDVTESAGSVATYTEDEDAV
jgi:6-pyruvoyltetrahydropterin/6-carboxytetrahydropterin synthase